MEVYVISQGAYSDYHNIGVISDKKQAEAWSRAGYGVQKWVVDAAIDAYVTPDGYSVFLVSMARNGDVIEIEVYNDPDYGGYESIDHAWWYDGKFESKCVARDEGQAVKITNERRAFMLANNKDEYDFSLQEKKEGSQ